MTTGTPRKLRSQLGASLTGSMLWAFSYRMTRPIAICQDMPFRSSSEDHATGWYLREQASSEDSTISPQTLSLPASASHQPINADWHRLSTTLHPLCWHHPKLAHFSPHLAPLSCIKDMIARLHSFPFALYSLCIVAVTAGHIPLYIPCFQSVIAGSTTAGCLFRLHPLDIWT